MFEKLNKKKALLRFSLPELIITISAAFFGVLSSWIVGDLTEDKSFYNFSKWLICIIVAFTGLLFLSYWASLIKDIRKNFSREDFNNPQLIKNFNGEFTEEDYKKHVKFCKMHLGIVGFIFLYLVPFLVPLIPSCTPDAPDKSGKLNFIMYKVNDIEFLPVLKGKFDNRISKTIIFLTTNTREIKDKPMLFSSENLQSLKNPLKLKQIKSDPYINENMFKWEVNIPAGIDKRRLFYSILILHPNNDIILYNTPNGIEEDTLAPTPPKNIVAKDMSKGNVYSVLISWQKSVSEDVKSYKLTFFKKEKNRDKEECAITISGDQTFCIHGFPETGNYKLSLVAVDYFDNSSKPIFKAFVIKNAKNIMKSKKTSK